ncbi:MAG: hypothetical protein ACRD9Y_17235 [Blastocatellia bacterium]
MPYTMTFDVLHEYDAGDLGITVPVMLNAGALSRTVETKLDSGSTYCIFRRGIGEALGLDIETGMPQWISTPTGSFLTYGHEVTLSTLGFQFDVMVYFAVDEWFTRDVLGRFGWMQQLKLGVVDYEGKLYIGSYDANMI